MSRPIALVVALILLTPGASDAQAPQAARARRDAADVAQAAHQSAHPVAPPATLPLGPTEPRPVQDVGTRGRTWEYATVVVEDEGETTHLYGPKGEHRTASYVNAQTFSAFLRQVAGGRPVAAPARDGPGGFALQSVLPAILNAADADGWEVLSLTNQNIGASTTERVLVVLKRARR